MAKARKLTLRTVVLFSVAILVSLLYGGIVIVGSGVFSAWVVGATLESIPPERAIQFVVLWIIGAAITTLLAWHTLTHVNVPMVKVVRLCLLLGAGATIAGGLLTIGILNQQHDSPIPLRDMSSAQRVFPVVAVDDLYILTNQERETAGLGKLTPNPILEQSACMKVDDMINQDYWSHISPDGASPWYFFEEVNYVYHKAGENLAYGYPDGEHVIRGWMNSPTHRDNLLGDYTEVGYCAKVAGKFQGGKNNVIVGHYGRP